LCGNGWGCVNFPLPCSSIGNAAVDTGEVLPVMSWALKTGIIKTRNDITRVRIRDNLIPVLSFPVLAFPVLSGHILHSIWLGTQNYD